MPRERSSQCSRQHARPTAAARSCTSAPTRRSAQLLASVFYTSSKLPASLLVGVLAQEIGERGVTVNEVIATATDGAGYFTDGKDDGPLRVLCPPAHSARAWARSTTSQTQSSSLPGNWPVGSADSSYSSVADGRADIAGYEHPRANDMQDPVVSEWLRTQIPDHRQRGVQDLWDRTVTRCEVEKTRRTMAGPLPNKAVLTLVTESGGRDR